MIVERQSTPSAPEGDNYIADVPRRGWVNSEEHLPGQPLIVNGLVVNTVNEPLFNVGIEFWQADSGGVYHGAPHFSLRGRQGTGNEGGFHLDSIVPGSHQGRAPHIHARLFDATGTILTTEIFFPDKPENNDDPAFDPSRVVHIERRERPDGLVVARFDFVLASR